MSESTIVVQIQGEDDRWVTTFTMSELDALRVRNLWPSGRTSRQIELPSVSGFARISGETVSIAFKNRNSQSMVSAPFPYVRKVIDQAVESAANERRSTLAWNKIWAWAVEKSKNVQFLTLKDGEKIRGTLLRVEDEHVALALDNSSIGIASLRDECDIALVGADVLLVLDDDKNSVLSQAR